MKPIEFYKYLASIESSGELELSSGPFTIKVGQSDKDGAKLLIKLGERWTEETTFGDFEALLLSGMLRYLADSLDDNGGNFEEGIKSREVQAYLDALWWLKFFVCQVEPSCCPHKNTVLNTSGDIHYEDGEVWDDIETKVLCLDCGEVIDDDEDESEEIPY